MSDGLKRAVLATLVSRGPWATTDGEITGAQVAAVYEALARNAQREALAAVGALWPSDRRWDRATRLLKTAGLIRFDRGLYRWVTT